MKEMSLTHAEPFHVFEFRHGPKAMVTHSTLIVGLVSEHNYELEMQVLHEMSALVAHILTIGERVERIGEGEAFLCLVDCPNKPAPRSTCHSSRCLRWSVRLPKD